MAKKEKLQWKVKHKTSFSDEIDFLETILLDCGIKKEDIPTFLRPTQKCIHDPFLMKDMDKAIQLVKKHVDNGSRIFVKADCDVDGVTSATILINFLKELNPELQIDWLQNYEKRHGLFYEDVEQKPKDYYDLYIIPDASMTCKDAKDITRNFTGEILCLDHHIQENEFFNKKTNKWITRDEAKELYKVDKNSLEVDCYTNYCVAVNNTDGQYPNPTLSGAGVVQKFIEAYVDTYEENEELKTKYLELVSLGITADSMDIRNLESRYYVLEGLKEYRYSNELLKEMNERLKEDMPFGRTITSVGWKIAPLINGCVRYGSSQEQKDMFRAMLGTEEDVIYQPRRKHKDDPKPMPEIHSLQWDVARNLVNIKSRQDTEVRKFVKELDATIKDKELDKNSVIFVDGTKVLTKGTVSGLVANKLTSTYFRPVVLMRAKDSLTFGGSMRGYEKGGIASTKELLEKAGVIVAGHPNAGGISFKKENLQNIIDKCNELLPLDSLCTIHDCDWEIPANKLKREYVQEVAENYDVFGNTVPEPLFAITNLCINASQIHGYGEHNSFIRFAYHGINFTKKYCSYEDFDNMTLKEVNSFGPSRKNLKMNMICQFVLNSWEDKVTPEVKILYFDSVEDMNPDNDFYEELEKSTIKRPIEVNKVKTEEKQSNTINDLDFDW